MYMISFQYVPSSFGLPQSSINMPPQIQSSSQLSAPVGPAGSQQWMHSSQGISVPPVQQGSLQAVPPSTTLPVSFLVLLLFQIILLQV